MAANSGPVVSNTTPLINLVGVGLLDLWPGLHGTVWVLGAVRDEYYAGKSAADPDLDRLAWLTIVPAGPLDPTLPARLGAGEAAVLSLALAQNARAVLLDEAFGRRIARQRGLPLVETLSVLLAAKQANLLPLVRLVVEEMIRQGWHISTTLYAQVVRAAEE